MEDFAEIATYFALDLTGTVFKNEIRSSTGELYFDGYKHYQSEIVKPKREWVKAFFPRDLIYKANAN